MFFLVHSATDACRPALIVAIFCLIVSEAGHFLAGKASNADASAGCVRTSCRRQGGLKDACAGEREKRPACRWRAGGAEGSARDRSGKRLSPAAATRGDERQRPGNEVEWLTAFPFRAARPRQRHRPWERLREWRRPYPAFHPDRRRRVQPPMCSSCAAKADAALPGWNRSA